MIPYALLESLIELCIGILFSLIGFLGIRKESIFCKSVHHIAEIDQVALINAWTNG